MICMNWKKQGKTKQSTVEHSKTETEQFIDVSRETFCKEGENI